MSHNGVIFMRKSVIVGTAGHIDHGKSALVWALTGTDPDRWAEEKRRGITIDLGFAHLELDEELQIGFVDVPGHERFVKNMLAGASGIDVVLLVVAADESIKPQTREHFDICRLLEVDRGLVALTKADLVEPDLLELVKLELQDYLRGSFLEDASIVGTSVRTGAGLEELKAALREVAAQASPRNAARPFRLPLDRAFVMKGFGTVATGTLLSGAIGPDREIVILPEERRVRVRSVQVYGREVSEARAGQRTALNLAGVETGELRRGMVLAAPDTFRPTTQIDCRLTLLDSARTLKSSSRVHLHLGTSEQVAEIFSLTGKPLEPGRTHFVQLRLKEPTVAALGDRFIVRQFSPLVTLGGGAVLDSFAPRHKRKEPGLEDFLGCLADGAAEERFAALVKHRGVHTEKELAARTGWAATEIEKSIRTLRGQNLLWTVSEKPPVFLSCEGRDALARRTLDHLAAFHRANPLLPGISKEELRSRILAAPGRVRSATQKAIFDALLNRMSGEKKIAAEGETVRLASHRIILKEEEEEAKQTIDRAFREAGLTVPPVKEVLPRVGIELARAQSVLQILLREKALRKITEDLLFHDSALSELRRRLIEHKKKKNTITVGEFKDLAGVSRKYAIPLLEYLDRERVTQRRGDERVIL